MRPIIDTHTFLWFVDGAPLLSATALSLIQDANNEIFVNLVSAWETAIKVSTGKLTLQQDVISVYTTETRNNNMRILPIEIRHLAPIETLPFPHKDPFDRLLIAQAITEGMSVVSIDTAFDAYPVTRLW